MILDPFTSLWISNSAINEFIKCPRAYFIRNIYKDQYNSKVGIANPSLTVGSAVHEALDELAKVESSTRFNQPLLNIYNNIWESYSGKLGGFSDREEEVLFKEKGSNMLQRVINNPGPLLNKSLNKSITKRFPDGLPPRYDFSLDHEIILCGSIDWLEYDEQNDSINIIDFKTGKEEDPMSLQLAIYCLIAQNVQKRKVTKVSYWYLDRDDSPTEMLFPDCEIVAKQILDLALQIKKLRNSREFACPKNGCMSCLQLEPIVKGHAKFICNRKNRNVYMLPRVD